jgi:hypothetical protein
VTIQGKGFPEWAVSKADTVEVALPGGVPCQVQSSSYSTVTCIAGAAKALPAAAGGPNGTSWNGLYPGMRGVGYEIYYGRCESLPRPILLRPLSLLSSACACVLRQAPGGPLTRHHLP